MVDGDRSLPPSRLRVAILGPPNAGKSTLLNRLLDKKENRGYKLQAEKKGRKLGGRLASSSHFKNRKKGVGAGALVAAIPGTTRDRREAIGRLGDILFIMIDTAGVDGLRLKSWYRSRDKMSNEDDDDQDDYQRPMMEQAVLAAQEASVIFFMFDGRVGLSADDLETCRWLRRYVLSSSHPQRVVMVANKLEGNVLEDNPIYADFVEDASRAGFGPAIPVSALQGEGMADLALVLLETQQDLGLATDNEATKEKSSTRDSSPRPMQMAILGRPNVGKSTLVNALLEENRVITGSRPGLTRDAIRIPWTWQGQPVQIVDTAGIRKASQRQDPQATRTRKKATETRTPLLEDMAVQDAVRALQVADVAVLVIDAAELMLSKQDLVIANAILQEGRALVVVANKMDLVIDEQKKHDGDDVYTREDLARGVRNQLEARFPYLRKTPIIPLDSRPGRGKVADELMPIVMQARDRWERKISTGSLNRWLAEVVDGHPPPKMNGRATKLKYVIQTKGRPPTFLLYTNQDKLPDAYTRYLTRQFQETFEMYGMQVRLAVKKSTSSAGGNPYAPSSKKRKGFGLGGREARHSRGVERLKATGTRKLQRRKRK